MNDYLMAKIKDAFPDVMPSYGKITENECDEEALGETDEFYGLRWSEVTPLLFKDHAYSFCFLSAAARLFYLPALIKCSLENWEACEQVVLTFVTQLAEHQRAESRRENCYGELADAQWEIVGEWLSCLSKYHEFFYEEKLQQAQTAVRNTIGELRGMDKTGAGGVQ